MNTTLTPSQPRALRGVMMIAILWFAYVTFSANWIGGSMLSAEIINDFFGHPVSPIISQMINYTITVARTIANLLAAILLVRLGPQKAVILALALLMFATVAIWMPNYWVYTLARMVMALGGSMLVVYVNPVITRYIPQDKKVVATGLNVLSYNVGAFIISILFYFFADQLKADWKITMTVMASFTVVLFTLWLIFSENFETTKVDSSSEEEDKTATYGAVIKTTFIWKYIAVFTGFVFLYILSLTSLPVILGTELKLNGPLIALMVSLGAIIGTFLGIYLGKRDINRKPILFISGVIMVSCMTLLFKVSYDGHNTWSYILAFISGFFMFVQYPVLMNIPHEMKGLSPKKITIIFGYLWAFTYGGYTVLTIIWSLILGKYGLLASLYFYIIASALLYLVLLMLPETNPHRE